MRVSKKNNNIYNQQLLLCIGIHLNVKLLMITVRNIVRYTYINSFHSRSRDLFCFLEKKKTFFFRSKLRAQNSRADDCKTGSNSLIEILMTFYEP